MWDSFLLRFLFCNFFFVVQNPSRSQTAFFFNFSWHVYHSSETKRSMFDEKLPHFGILKRNPNCCFFISSNFRFATVDITSLKLLAHKEIYLRKTFFMFLTQIYLHESLSQISQNIFLSKISPINTEQWMLLKPKYAKM